MRLMMQAILLMVGAARLETGGDAMIRQGLLRHWLFPAGGALSLVAYGIFVRSGHSSTSAGS